MSKKYILYVLCCLFSSSNIFTKQTIKAICFDIETLFEVDSMRASNYVGKIDSLRYLKETGHFPCQADLFEKLTEVKAQSTIFTENNNLKMPLIFSDWLMNVQPASSLEIKILTFLNNSKLSDIEKKVFGNIVAMMLTPSSLVDTQKTVNTTISIIFSLSKKGYKVFLVGNWANLECLQQNFHETLKIFNGIFISGKIHLLKPDKDFYTTILQKINFDSESVLWIEKENYFANKAQQYNLNFILNNNPKNKSSIIKDLQKFNINI